LPVPIFLTTPLVFGPKKKRQMSGERNSRGGGKKKRLTQSWETIRPSIGLVMKIKSQQIRPVSVYDFVEKKEGVGGKEGKDCSPKVTAAAPPEVAETEKNATSLVSSGDPDQGGKNFHRKEKKGKKGFGAQTLQMLKGDPFDMLPASIIWFLLIVKRKEGF